MGLNLKSLIGKLNDTTRSVLEAAAGLCLSRTHYDIEIEHYLMKLLELATDLAHQARQLFVSKQRENREAGADLNGVEVDRSNRPGLRQHL